MSTLLLKPGSKGSHVETLQELLNHGKVQAKTNKPVQVDGIFGINTKEAVLALQKKLDLSEKGFVGPLTAGALGQLAGSKYNSFVKLFGAPPVADEEEARPVKIYEFDYKGTRYTLTEEQYKEVKASFIEPMKKYVLALDIRAQTACGYWEEYNKINSDQYIVSWFVHIGGLKLPDKSLFTAAENAVKRVKNCHNGSSTDIAALANAIRDAEGPVNKAYEAIMTYRHKLEKRSDGWVDGLTITRDASFAAFCALGGAAFGTGLAAAALVSGGAAVMQNVATQVGQNIATSRPVSGWDVLTDGIAGATIGAVLRDGGLGKSIMEGLSKKVVANVGGKWLVETGRKGFQRYAAKWMAGTGAALVQETLEASRDLIKAGVTKDVFFDKLWEKLKPKLLNTVMMGGLDAAISRNVTHKMGHIYKNNKKLMEAFGKKERNAITALTQEFLKGSGGKLITSCLDEVLAAASGKEDEEEISKRTMELVMKQRELDRIIENVINQESR